MNLNQPIESFRYIGPIYLKRLHNLGIKTLRDFFYHFPFRYDNFFNLKKISEIKIGEEVTIQGKIEKISTRKTFRKKMFITEALIGDKSGTIKSIWFNQPYLTETLKEGTSASFAGKIKESGSSVFLSSPAYEKINQQLTAGKRQAANLIHTQGLVPIYPETEGLSSRWLRFIIHPLLKKYISEIKEFLPKEILKDKNFPEIKKALFQIHFPENKKEAEIAKRRFSFEELFLIQLFYQDQKKKLQKKKALKIIPKKEYIEKFKKNLPFSFTNDQKKAIREILGDMQKEFPMSRLLEGEVGSGKTIVATLSAFVAAKNNRQTAIMAPTEILAEQHFKEISKILSKLKIKIGLLTSEQSLIYPKENFFSKKGIAGKESKAAKERKLIEEIKNGKIDILIGTHSIIKERVKFKNLGLVVVDEQHRFGVEQRASLSRKTDAELKTQNYAKENFIPHFLSMTATPIPRTLALALYGDLSISQIKELPKGRKKIETKIVPSRERQQIYEFLRKEVSEGKQGFVICPLIEESKKLARPSQKTEFGFYLSFGEIAAAEKEFKKLKEKIFPDLKLGLLHGKMKQKEKEETMKNFKNGKIQILVSTPVIEVGIDIPNATVMIIEGSDRFGLSQLYQFRGRVGRGKFKSYCFLFAQSPAMRTNQRLKAIVSAKNAFELAEKDLKIRGPGDLAGARQSGIPDLAMASLSDISLIREVKEEIERILKKDPELKKYPLLQKKLEDFKQRIFLE